MSVMMFVDGILLLSSPGMLAVEKREKSRRIVLVFVALNSRENLGIAYEPDSLIGEPDIRRMTAPQGIGRLPHSRPPILVTW